MSTALIKYSTIISTLTFLLLLFTLPVLAQEPTTQTSLSELAQCTGPDCSTCNIVYMANGLIKWLIGIVFLLFAGLLAIAGVRLVTSGGNPGALQSAKDNFMNALIGFVIILSAWLIIDTLMRALVGNSEVDGSDGFVRSEGEASGWLFWSQVECVGRIAVSTSTPDFIDLDQGYDTRVQVPPIIEPRYARGQGLDISLPNGSTVRAVSCDSASMVSVPFLGSSVQIHRTMAPSLRRIDSAWRARGGHSFYRVTSVGGYSCRGTASGGASFHSYGLAVDINPAQNPHCPTWPGCGGRNVLVTDMPPAFVSMFLAEGWGWGGNWNSSKDAMHFSKGRGEQGDLRGE